MSDHVPSPAADPRDTKRPKVPAFARYDGTSAWRGDKRRVRAFAWWKANEARKARRAAASTPS